ncbi:MAG: TIGR03749 family integrating conjugative element protein [Gammaproteobacteria bacterium]|nr:TIGR03749 family integrating conjugative element protein [Gammaproteobacteria bacterium]
MKSKTEKKLAKKVVQTLSNQLNLQTKTRPRRRCKLVALLLLLTSSVTASTTELVWDKTPIPLDLEVGEERMIHFSGAMSIGLPASLRAVVRVQSIGNTVYLLASQSFERKRVLMRSSSDGSVVVFDIAAGPEPAESKNVYVRSAKGMPERQEGTTDLNYANLTRFAAQVAYAPNRLVRVPKGVFPSSTPNSAKRLVRGLLVETVPYAAWKTKSGLHLTAIKIVNTSDEAVELHPRQLRGRWLAATFHHYRLLPSGSGANQTVVYLISRYPFKQAVEL